MNLRHQIAWNAHLKPGSPVSVPIGRRKTQQQLHFQQIIFGRNISASPKRIPRFSAPTMVSFRQNLDLRLDGGRVQSHPRLRLDGGRAASVHL